VHPTPVHQPPSAMDMDNNNLPAPHLLSKTAVSYESPVLREDGAEENICT
jgi:hypothetical protein